MADINQTLAVGGKTALAQAQATAGASALVQAATGRVAFTPITFFRTTDAADTRTTDAGDIRSVDN